MHSNPGSSRRQRGVTLVELMVALVLGLVVSGAALALFLTNKQTYVATENLDRLQEASRTAFELMARDLREADGKPCSNEIPITNQLAGAATYAWWSNWGRGLGMGVRGYADGEAFSDAAFGTGEGDRVDGTPAIEVWTATPTGSVLSGGGAGTDPILGGMAATNEDLVVTDTTGKFAANDILVICDYAKGTIFQATGVSANKIEHHAGGTPGNTNGNLPPGVYGINSVISRLHAERWYIGYTDRTDRDGNTIKSLYRTSLTDAATDQTHEIVEGVTDMVLEYHVRSAGAYAVAPVDWGNVDAVQITLTMAGRDRISTDKDVSGRYKVLQREFTNVVALRSRAE